MKLQELKRYNVKEDCIELVNKLIKIFSAIKNEEIASVSTTKKSEFVYNLLLSMNLNLEMEKSTKAGKKDRVDVYGVSGNYDIIIEIDNMRADQVTKKLFSKPLMLDRDKEIIYFSLLYRTKGNREADSKECETYIFGHFGEFIDRNPNIQYIAIAPK